MANFVVRKVRIGHRGYKTYVAPKLKKKITLISEQPYEKFVVDLSSWAFKFLREIIREFVGTHHDILNRHEFIRGLARCDDGLDKFRDKFIQSCSDRLVSSLPKTSEIVYVVHQRLVGGTLETSSTDYHTELVNLLSKIRHSSLSVRSTLETYHVLNKYLWSLNPLLVEKLSRETDLEQIVSDNPDRTYLKRLSDHPNSVVMSEDLDLLLYQVPIIITDISVDEYTYLSVTDFHKIFSLEDHRLVVKACLILGSKDFPGFIKMSPNGETKNVVMKDIPTCLDSTEFDWLDDIVDGYF